VSAQEAAASETRGYSENKEAVRKRLRRIEGQVRGVERMVAEERYCIDVVTQVTAIQAALDKVALELLADHAAHCVVGAPASKQDERTEELMSAVRRLLRHG
jgi:DNA-binding FrmR family transcriptional regulator